MLVESEVDSTRTVALGAASLDSCLGVSCLSSSLGTGAPATLVVCGGGGGGLLEVESSGGGLSGGGGLVFTVIPGLVVLASFMVVVMLPPGVVAVLVTDAIVLDNAASCLSCSRAANLFISSL
jgi:hypothetical protein